MRLHFGYNRHYTTGRPGSGPSGWRNGGENRGAEEFPAPDATVCNATWARRNRLRRHFWGCDKRNLLGCWGWINSTRRTGGYILGARARVRHAGAATSGRRVNNSARTK